MLALAAGLSAPARAQQIVFDPKSYAESALQTAQQLEMLSNQATLLVNQARQLAASPYSHAVQTAQALQDISALARQLQGLAADASRVEAQFQDLYPTAVTGLDAGRLLQQARDRAGNAAATAQDLARTAAELERLSAGRAARVSGALSAAQAATGVTAAVQSSAQLLAAVSEDVSSLQVAALAQSRLMAEEAARRAADDAAAGEQHRRLWAHPADPPPPAPRFDPLPLARN